MQNNGNLRKRKVERIYAYFDKIAKNQSSLERRKIIWARYLNLSNKKERASKKK